MKLNDFRESVLQRLTRIETALDTVLEAHNKRLLLLETKERAVVAGLVVLVISTIASIYLRK